jgi:RNA polymerase sigma-70 factor, ECF subfamily
MRVLSPHSLAPHRERLVRVAWGLCGSSVDAEDLVQETFARVLSRPRLVRDEAGELAYLVRVLHNTFLSGRRDAARRPRAVVAVEEVTVLDRRATGAPQRAAEVGELYEAIAELPERYRRALVAVDMLGLSYGETGRSLGVREATVATRVFRARRMVIDALGEEGGPGADAALAPSTSRDRQAA